MMGKHKSIYKKWVVWLCVLGMMLGGMGPGRLALAEEDVVIEGLEDSVPTATADFGLTAVSAVLMEASTGTVVYEKNADQALSPASITKIMTLILIFDALRKARNMHTSI